MVQHTFLQRPFLVLDDKPHAGWPTDVPPWLTKALSIGFAAYPNNDSKKLRNLEFTSPSETRVSKATVPIPPANAWETSDFNKDVVAGVGRKARVGDPTSSRSKPASMPGENWTTCTTLALCGAETASLSAKATFSVFPKIESYTMKVSIPHGKPWKVGAPPPLPPQGARYGSLRCLHHMFVENDRYRHP